MEMRKLLVLSIFGLLFLSAANLNAEQVYSYTGALFTNVEAPYTTSDRISGNITLDLPLAPSLSAVDLTNLLSDFSFTDGQQLRTPGNSTVCRFEISTDGAGNISGWSIFFREAPTPMPSMPQQTLDIMQLGDQVGTAGANVTACGDLTNLSPFAENNTPGSWTNAVIQPTDYSYTGQLFASVTPPYTTNDRITGGFTVTGPLNPYLPITDLQTFLLDFSFTDGVQTRTPANSTVCFFNAATDGTGNIIGWRIALREAPTPASGNPQQSLATTTDVDQGLSIAAGATACADVLGAFSQGQVFAGGSWSSIAIQPLQSTTYTYTGDPFTFAEAPYSIGDSINGSIRVATPLPPSLPATDFSDLLLAFSFSDGQQIRTQADSFVCSAILGTDATGNIIFWSVAFQESPLPASADAHSLGTTTTSDSAGFNMPSFSCESLAASPGASNQTGGTWMLRNLPSIPIPSLSPVGLILLAMLLFGLAVRHQGRLSFGTHSRNKRS